MASCRSGRERSSSAVRTWNAFSRTKVRSGLAVFERRLFVGGHALFGHREQHGDADIGSGDPSQIDDLLFAENLLGPIERNCGLLGHFELCDADHRQLGRLALPHNWSVEDRGRCFQ